jgi:hypothetical protein
MAELVGQTIIPTTTQSTTVTPTVQTTQSLGSVKQTAATIIPQTVISQAPSQSPQPSAAILPTPAPSTGYAKYVVQYGYYWGIKPSGGMERLNPSSDPYPQPQSAAATVKSTSAPIPLPDKPKVGSTKAEIRTWSESYASIAYANALASGDTPPNKQLLANQLYNDSIQINTPKFLALQAEGESKRHMSSQGNYSGEFEAINTVSQLVNEGSKQPSFGGGGVGGRSGDLVSLQLQTMGTPYSPGGIADISSQPNKQTVGNILTSVSELVGAGAKALQVGGASAAPIKSGVQIQDNQPAKQASLLAGVVSAGKTVVAAIPGVVITTASKGVDKAGKAFDVLGDKWETTNKSIASKIPIADKVKIPIQIVASVATPGGPLGSMADDIGALAGTKILNKLNINIPLTSQRTIREQYLTGEYEGLKEKPLEAAAIAAVSFALPGVVGGAGKLASKSKTVAKLVDTSYTPGKIGTTLLGSSEKVPIGKYLFGEVTTDKIVVKNIGTKANPIWANRIESRNLNLPIAAVETGLGVWWAQSVVERVTARPTQKQILINSSITPGSSRTWKEGDQTITEIVGPTTDNKYKIETSLNPAIPARLTFDKDKGRLVWNADIAHMPALSDMVYQSGKITSVEVAPAVGGFMAGQWFWPKASGAIRTRGLTEINIGPESRESGVLDAIFKSKRETVKGGIGYETGYPISNKITAKSLMQSFEQGTLKPFPKEMVNYPTKEVPYIPEHAFLPGESPTGKYGFSGWETDPGKIGQKYILGGGLSEMQGQYISPDALFYFTKVPGQGPQKVELFGFGLPKMNEPTMVRTEIAGFETLPAHVRTIKDKDAFYSAANLYAQTTENAKALLPLRKAEYEGVIPTFSGKGQTQIEVMSRRFYAKVRGTKVPIVETKVIDPWDDLTLGAKQGASRVREIVMPESSYFDRQAMERLDVVAKNVKGMRTSYEDPIDFTKIQSLDPSHAHTVQTILAKNDAIVYGSSARLGQMPAERIVSTYRRLPGDVDIRVKDFVKVSRELARTIGGKTEMSFSGVKVLNKSGETVFDVHPITIKYTPGSPQGWKPTEFVKAGGIRYERLNQQIQRYALGNIRGHPERGKGWVFGPKSGRIEKDVLGFYGDVQYLLETQQVKGGKVKQIAGAMQDIRAHPLIKQVIGNKKYYYGPGKGDFFAGYPLGDYYGRPSFINLTTLGIGKAITSVIPTSRGKVVSGGDRSIVEVTSRGYHPSSQPNVGSSGGKYSFSQLSSPRSIISDVAPIGKYSTSKPTSESISKFVFGRDSSASGRSASPSIISYKASSRRGGSGGSGRSGSSIDFSSIAGVSGRSGGSGRSGMTGISGISGGSGRSGGSIGISGITGVSGRSGGSGGSGRSGVSGGSGRSGGSGGSGGSGRSGGTSGVSGLTGISGGSRRSGVTGISGGFGGSGRSGGSGGSGRSGGSGGSGGSGRSGRSGGTSTSGKTWTKITTKTTTTNTPTFTPRRTRVISFEFPDRKPKKLRLHFDVLGSKWNIRNPIPRFSSGKYPNVELKIENKQYSRHPRDLTYHRPYDKFITRQNVLG